MGEKWLRALAFEVSDGTAGEGGPIRVSRRGVAGPLIRACFPRDVCLLFPGVQAPVNN